MKPQQPTLPGCRDLREPRAVAGRVSGDAAVVILADWSDTDVADLPLNILDGFKRNTLRPLEGVKIKFLSGFQVGDGVFKIIEFSARPNSAHNDVDIDEECIKQFLEEIWRFAASLVGASLVAGIANFCASKYRKSVKNETKPDA